MSDHVSRYEDNPSYEYKHSFVKPYQSGAWAGVNDAITQQLQQAAKGGWRILDLERTNPELWSVVWERVS